MATANIPNSHGSQSVFLSHSSKDASLALQLCARLEAQGISCWIAPRDVTPGRPFAEECVRGIEQCGSFILLASANAVSSVQVLSEVEQAHKRGKPLYTVMLGKPKVSRELDYYISRLHWIEYAGDSVDSLASRLAKVISGGKSWTEVASPPSLRRTILYRGGAMFGAVIATVFVLLAAGAGFYHRISRGFDLDYRRLGYVTAAIEPGRTSSFMTVDARVWLLAEGVPFREVSFVTVADAPSGSATENHSKSFNPAQVGSQQLVQFPLPIGTSGLTSCLSIPSPGLHDRYRVTQKYSIGADHSISPIADPQVTKDDNSPCGRTP